MVLGFALCTTFAFAQTNVNPRNLDKLRAEKLTVNQAKAEQVDYKASIFTKDANYDTLRTFRFSASDMAEITFGTIASTDHIMVDGRDSTFGLDAHSVNVQTNGWAQWRRYADSATFKNNFMNDYPTWVGRFYCGDGEGGTDFAYVLNRIGAGNNANDPGYEDDGFMFFGFDANNNALSVGMVNSYMVLPEITRTLTRSNMMVVVGVNQAYYSFYDQCFVDYQIGNTWYTREINVNGIDCEVNSTAPSKARYVMPSNLSDQTSIKLRIRVSAAKYAAYGYGWFLDNFAVMTDNRTESWDFNRAVALDGFYGTMPQGMTIPMTYGVHVRNTNINDLPNTKLVVKNAPENGAWTTVASGTPYTIPAGNPLKDYKLAINERGFMVESPVDDTLFTWGIHSYLGRFENYGNQGPLTGGYLGRSLNTSTVGANYYTINAEGGSLTMPFDTVLYTVSDEVVFLEEADSNRVDGYRWAHDNGLVPSNSDFAVGFTSDGYLDAADVAGHATMAGYRVFVRYVTGSEVPEDFVFRGIEYVPATLENPENMETQSGVLLPIIYEEVPDENGDLDWYDVPCGIDNMLYPITADAVNNLPTTYALPGSNYSALNIKFLDEPRLKANTSYLVGYLLYEEAQFKVAQQQWGYRDGNTTVRYTANEATAPYYNQNTPSMPFDVIVYDANGSNSSGSHWILGWNIDNYPMIRPIVGSPSPVVRVPYSGACENNLEDAAGNDTLGIAVRHGVENLCDDDADVAVGTNQSFEIYPAGDHAVIDHIFINGEEINVHSDDDEVGDSPFVLYDGNYDVTTDDGDILLSRNYYRLYVYGVPNEAVTISATFHWEAHTVGIDPVAANVNLSLAPNPATSSVKLNLSGVTGMVNCNIIDMSGRVVYNANINAEAETTINVSSMPAGAYFVRVTNDSFSKIEKLIIK